MGGQIRWWLIGGWLLAPLLAQAQAYGAPEISAFGVGDGRRMISVRVAPVPRTEVPAQPVPFTLEGLALAGRRPTTLTERNVLGSGLSFDLDGDGTLKGRWPVSCVEGALQIGPWTVPALGLARQVVPAEAPRLGPAGASVLLYGDCGDQVLLGVAAGALTRAQLPGPVLQITVVEPIDLKAKFRLVVDDFVVNGQPATGLQTAEVRSWTEGAKPGWVAVHLALVPIPPTGVQTVDFRVEGAGPGVVSAAVSTSNEAGVRVRERSAGRPLP